MRSILSLLAGAFVCGACAGARRPPIAEERPFAHDAGDLEDASADADDGDSDAGDAALAIGENGCPPNMVPIGTEFCIDRYEASLVEVTEDGSEHAWTHYLPVEGHSVKALSQPAVIPQSYISAVEAEDACQASGKRLCSLVEWRKACRGPGDLTYPYGDTREPGTCNDHGRNAMAQVFGAELAQIYANTAKATIGKPKIVKRRKLLKKKAKPVKARVKAIMSKVPKKKPTLPMMSLAERAIWSKLNDPRLGQVAGTVALTGEHAQCTNAYGVFDMVGNRHEWVHDETDSGNGIFVGGYFLDTQINGEGCNYRTSAHDRTYHDYSTGFRCCADLSKEQ